MSVTKKSIDRLNKLASSAKSNPSMQKSSASTPSPKLHKAKPAVRTLPPHLL